MLVILLYLGSFRSAYTHRVDLQDTSILTYSPKTLASLAQFRDEQLNEDLARAQSKTLLVSAFLLALSNHPVIAKQLSGVTSNRISSRRTWHPATSSLKNSLGDARDVDRASVLESCMSAVASFKLPEEAAQCVENFITEMLVYNERTNIYSQSAYKKLPFHVADSITLALHIRDDLDVRKGVLDLGSGSGLPSLIVSCVNPELPVYAVESKSRKTRFLTNAARKIGLQNYTPLTQNVRELVRSWVFDVDVVIAKAFKPLNEVGPIGQRCILDAAQLLVPISEAQVKEFSLTTEKLVRQREFIYFSDRLLASHGAHSRKIVTAERARASRL